MITRHATRSVQAEEQDTPSSDFLTRNFLMATKRGKDELFWSAARGRFRGKASVVESYVAANTTRNPQKNETKKGGNPPTKAARAATFEMSPRRATRATHSITVSLVYGAEKNPYLRNHLCHEYHTVRTRAHPFDFLVLASQNSRRVLAVCHFFCGN